MTSGCFLIIITTITLCFGLSNFVVNGKTITLSDVVKTIQMENGVYDCVDFYKQPAFDHPSLKNHSYYPEDGISGCITSALRGTKMKPSFRPNSENKNENSDEGFDDMGLKGEGCPDGSVPIIRNIDEEHQLISESRLKRYAQLGEKQVNEWSASRIYFALGQSRSNMRRMYNGLGANITVWNPSVLQYQYSSSEIIMKSGNDAIIVGLTTNPMVYKDGQTRLFIYAVSGNSYCMNSRCGFIQVDKNFPLGIPVKPYSTLGGQIRVYRFYIYKEPKTGNWWFQVGMNQRNIGFWPKSFFNTLSVSGTYFVCGGEAYRALDEGFPQMGSGVKPTSDRETGHDESFCQNVEFIDQDFKPWTETEFDPYYDIEDEYNVETQKKGDDYLVYFGGPY